MTRTLSHSRRIADETILRAKKIEGLSQIYLGVITFNEAAKRMYESHGFKSYGIEINSMKHNGNYFDEEIFITLTENDSGGAGLMA